MAAQFLLALVLSVSAVASETCTKVVTINPALTGSVPRYETRKIEVMKALRAIEADVDFACIQSIWREDHLQTILSQASKEFPYHFSALHSDVGQLRYSQDGEAKSPTYSRGSACSDDDVQYFSKHILPCAAANGCLAELDTDVKNAVACMARNCKSVLKNETFNPDCFSCITLTSPAHAFSTSDCVLNQERSNRLNGVGLVLLSRKPILNAVYHRFFEGRNITIPRGFVSAEHPDIGKVFCAHLSPDIFPNIEYDLEYDSTREQRKDEVRDLNNHTDDSEHILMGCLNAGPQISSNDPEKNLTAVDSETFTSWVNSGYSAPYITQDGRCTLCKLNPIANRPNSVNDHILLKGKRISRTAMKRIFDQSPPLSNHYGVQGDLCRA